LLFCFCPAIATGTSVTKLFFRSEENAKLPLLEGEEKSEQERKSGKLRRRLRDSKRHRINREQDLFNKVSVPVPV
jgi:hypothetical protein